MHKTQFEIDPHQVAKNINDTINDIHENFDPEKLSEEAQEKILEQLIDVKNLALEIKAQLNESKK